MGITEAEIRQRINDVLREEYFYSRGRINESYAVNLSPGEFSQIFLDPWKEAWQGTFAELKKIAASAVVTLRLALTLNQKKAEEIWARHKDRMAKFSKESDDAMQKLGGTPDLDAAMFILNPGPWVAKKVAAGAEGAVDFAKQIGIGDISAATVSGEESKEDALIRRREQEGPVKKALRALEQIFFLAHAAPSGPLIVEGVEEDIESQIMSGPLGASLQKQREEFLDELELFVEIVNSVAAQNMFLSTIARIETANDPMKGLGEMDQALKKLAAEDAEAAKSFASLPADIQKEAAELAKTEKFRTELEKQAEDDGEVDYEKEALLTVMGSAFADNYDQYLKSIMDNNKILDDTFQTLFGSKEIPEDLVDAVGKDVKGFAEAVRLAEKVLQRRLIS